MQDQAQEKKKEQETFEGMEDIKTHVDSWQRVLEENTKTKRLGGLSNEIWMVTTSKKVEPRSVIYRKFGPAGAIVDRERENYILEGLSKKGIAPMYFGGDEEYRVEEFCDSKSMTPAEINEKPNRRRLARLLATLHSMEFEKLDQTPLFLRILNGNEFMTSFKEKCEKEDVFSPIEKKLVKEISTLVSEEEIAFLKGLTPKKKESVVFSHNDLHSQNVLVLDKNGKFRLIDYEYSDYNYRGIDIANFFNELIFEYDIEEPPHYALDESKYPSDKDIRDFIKYYLFFFRYEGENFELSSILQNDEYRDEYIKKNHDIEDFDKEAEEIFNEMKICTLFSHYFWILWGVIMSKDGDFKFDHIHYSYKRYELYQKLKEKFIPNKDKGSQQTSAP